MPWLVAVCAKDISPEMLFYKLAPALANGER